jgi:hypothetical protein
MPDQNRPPGYRARDRPYSLGQAADDGRVIIVKCTVCRKVVHFLASDLLEVLGDPNRPALDPPFKCSRCNQADYMRMDIRSLTPGDIGLLTVRRLGKPFIVRKWRNVKY